jgi:hypothetical protein
MTALIHKIRHHSNAVTDIYAQLAAFTRDAEEILKHGQHVPPWVCEILRNRLGAAHYAINQLDDTLNP